MGSSTGSRQVRPNQIRVDHTEKLLPDDRRTSEWFARLGYSTAEAIADLIDNSIDAKANKVLIRIVRSDQKILRVLVVDDGSGMNEKTLAEAMRFGGGEQKTEEKLGKYGIGLKAASLSQARTVTVLSKQGDQLFGRRWTAENIGKGWICEVLLAEDVRRYMRSSFKPISIEKSGTIIIWEDLEHLKANPATIDKTLNTAIGDIAKEIGLRFHRILAGKVSVLIDCQVPGEHNNGWMAVEALDPFSYSSPGKEGYPKSLSVELPLLGDLKIECHIWPPKSNENGYKLGGGKVSARQGFYFYRNNRLIQAGGWNQSREDDNEPHLSLARVKIDLPSRMDSAFKLDVKKTKVEPPPDFASAVNLSSNPSSSFKQFIQDAQSVYRKQKVKDGALFTHLPGRGFPAQYRLALKRILWSEGTGKPQLVHFIWSELDPDIFVEMDRGHDRLILNSLYRQRVLQSKRASSADAPFVKLLLLLLFQREFDRMAISGRFREWMEKINRAMIAMLKRDI